MERHPSAGQSRAVLGISAFYHDSAAAILVDGECIAAAQEERFTRRKHDASFPINAIRYVLEAAGLTYADLAAVAFYEKPLLKFERILVTAHAVAPRGLAQFLKAMPVWLKEKLFMRGLLRRHLEKLATPGTRGKEHPPFFFPEHHLSHAASAFYPSPFEEAAILTIDGVGEWATTTIAHGKAGKITILKEGRFPHSLGLLYSAFTTFLGFAVNDGEYKLMGLAAYGDPKGSQTREMRDKITTHLVDIREDGSIVLNMPYFRYTTGLSMFHQKKWAALFGFPQREPEIPIGQHHMDLALAIQQVTETILINLARTARRLTGSPHLVMAGGVALNCVANARLAGAAIFDQLWVPPGAGDAGGAPGAAFAAWHLAIFPGQAKKMPLKDACLGPSFGDHDICRLVRQHNIPHHYFTDFADLAAFAAKLLAEGKIIGWFQDRMEFGPRALGNRSILADPANPGMQKRLNEKIKMREGFRPFAPAVLDEDYSVYFAAATTTTSTTTTTATSAAATTASVTATASVTTAASAATSTFAARTCQPDKPLLAYMLTVAAVREVHRHPEPPGYNALPLYPRLYHLRSILPAVTHLDYTARVQTVSHQQNPRFHQLLREFKQLTGYGVLINTSFNVRDEPIVCTPEDAWKCFCNTEMDGLVVGNYFFDRSGIRPT